MPLQATSGAASYDGFGGGVAVVPTYIEEVFSSYLWTGDGSSAQNINNGIDLAGKGGMVWVKSRSNATTNVIVDTSRFVSSSNIQCLFSDSTAAASASANEFGSFNSNGFSIPYNTTAGWTNFGTRTFASWTFREQPKFFDVVTYTGTGSNTTIAHSLGAVPGSIIVKRTDTTAAWAVYHRSLANTQYLVLNTTAAAATGATWWNSTTPTSTVFSVGTDASVNASGGTYVAYLFAHDAGGFGLTGTDNVISCGSFTTDGSGYATVNLGYEPQWVLTKATSATSNWRLTDTMRGYLGGVIPTSNQVLYPDTSGAETTTTAYNGTINATGFVPKMDVSTTFIYIAIRRGPMKVPTLGTSVFSPVARAGTSATATVTTGFPVDMTIIQDRTQNSFAAPFDRLRGATNRLFTPFTSAEASEATTLTSFAVQNGFTLGTDLGAGFVNTTGDNYINWCFGRAPGFFDEVCYTGTGSALNPTHSLGVTPELKIIKSRSGAVAWIVGGSVIGGGVNFYMFLETNAIVESTNYWSSGSDSATTFSTRAGNSTSNSNGQTYVAYLFATCAGVSKVFSYTGNGSSQTINCGFTGGARFVLIKRTDSTGDWYVWDSARGIVAGNDPHLSLNTTAAEVTTDDSVDTDNTGFIVNQVAATNVNVSSATYIGLAIA